MSTQSFAQRKKTVEYVYSKVEFGPIVGIGNNTPFTGNIKVANKGFLSLGWQWNFRINKKSHLLFNFSYENSTIDTGKFRRTLSTYYLKPGYTQYVELGNRSRNWTNMRYSLAYAYKVYTKKFDVAPFVGFSAVQVLTIPHYQIFSRSVSPDKKEIIYLQESTRERFQGGLVAGAQFTKRLSRVNTIYLQPELGYQLSVNKATEYLATPGYNNRTQNNLNYGLTGFRYGIKLGVMLTPFNRIMEGEKR